jgi:hypothetical protein
MSDFLGHLVTRSLDLGPAAPAPLPLLQPRAPSLFEPIGPQAEPWIPSVAAEEEEAPSPPAPLPAPTHPPPGSGDTTRETKNI